MDPSTAKNETDSVPKNDDTVDGVTVARGPIMDKLKEIADKLNADKGGADPVVDPATPKPQKPDWLKWAERGVWIATVILSIASSIYLFKQTGKIVIPDLPPIPSGSTTVEGDDGQVYGMAWVNDPEAVKESFARVAPTIFGDTPAGKIAQGDVQEAFLWRSVRKAAGKGELDSWYPNVNQLDVGMCVGCGWKHGVDVALANQVITGRAQKWEPVSAAVIYGGSRVEIGGGRIRGDGSVGAWAREFVRSRGVAPMRKYPSVDLSVFDPQIARKFGQTGVPDDIEDVARENPVQGTALVSTWADVQRAISQGYPVAVCSNVGFNNPNGTTGTRDKDGFCAPRGTWPHCMVFIGVRGGSREGAFCLNSWGDTAHGGPVWPADAPRAGFWVDAKTVERMVSQNDSFAIADIAGFPARKIDWFTW